MNINYYSTVYMCIIASNKKSGFKILKVILLKKKCSNYCFKS